MRLCLPVIALTGALVASAAAQQPQDRAQIEAELKAGAQAMQSGQPAQAEAHFKQVTELAPGYADGFVDLGLAQLRQGQSARAVDSLSAAVRLGPQTPNAHMFLGIADYQLHRLEAARSALTDELQIQPQDTQALLWLGIVDLADNKADDAATTLDRAAKLAPDDLNILAYRGRAHAQVVRENYERMYRIDPNSWQVHRALGEVYAEQGQPKAAIDEFQTAIAKQPRDADLYEDLGGEYQKVSQFELAAKAYQKELELSPGNPVAIFNLGRIRIEHGDPSQGVQMLEQVRTVYAGSQPLNFYLGLGLVDTGKYSEAVPYLEKASQQDGSRDLKGQALYQLARAYRRLDRPADAQTALDRFAALKSVPTGHQSSARPPAAH